VAVASTRCVLRDALRLHRSAPQHDVVVDGIGDIRHPEEAAERSSRRTHGLDPAFMGTYQASEDYVIGRSGSKK
jgi:hypothetical protein